MASSWSAAAAQARQLSATVAAFGARFNGHLGLKLPSRAPSKRPLAFTGSPVGSKSVGLRQFIFGQNLYFGGKSSMMFAFAIFLEKSWKC